MRTTIDRLVPVVFIIFFPLHEFLSASLIQQIEKGEKCKKKYRVWGQTKQLNSGENSGPESLTLSVSP